MSKRKYIVKNRWRLFIPYTYTHETYAKKRWLGRTIPEVFSEEFHHYDAEWICSRLRAGKVKIKRQRLKATTIIAASPDHLFEEGDLLVWKDHKHFAPIVADVGIRIVYEDNEIVVVEKSGGLLTASYDYCAKEIVEERVGCRVYTVHRLDRLTSGLLLFAKTAIVANYWKNEFQAHAVKKSYYAIVVGTFPEGVVVADQPLWLNKANHKVEVSQREGKEAVTIFERVGGTVNGCSLLRCHPKTGRTHQIRAHLEHLGYPISNDPLYNSDSHDGWIIKDASDMSKFADFVWDSVEGKHSAPDCFICRSKTAFEEWLKKHVAGTFQESIFLHSSCLFTKAGNFSSEPDWAKAWLRTSALADSFVA